MLNFPIVGIDPGLGGGIAIIWPEDLQLFDTPSIVVERASGKKKRMYDTQEMYRILRLLQTGSFKYEPPHCFIEDIHAMPGQGVTSMFSMGYGMGLWLGLLTALSIPYTKISPQMWKKSFSLSKDKNLSILRAKELFPHADITLKKHEGRAEALLLAEYGRRNI